MKKKILTLCLVVALAATAIVGGTLAYFTDTDKEVNTFTVGGVKIDLIEQQRGENGGLVDFKDGAVLMPIVGSAQGEKDAYGLPTAENYVDKIVTVKNLSSNAWVRVYYAIPTVLDNVGDASQNIVHVNGGNKFVAAGNKADGNAVNEDYTKNMGEEVYVGAYTGADQVSYNLYYRDYNKILTKDEVTGSAFMVGLYLDKNVDMDKDGYTINGTRINFDFSNGVNIPVAAVGVQAAGFNTAAAAVEAAFGTNFNPFTAE